MISHVDFILELRYDPKKLSIGAAVLDLKQLRYFVGVAEHMSFRKAARTLHITEPPLSRQIRLLEQELGVDLFIREKRRVHLTSSGEQLLVESKLLLESAQRIRDTIGRSPAKVAGSLKVGIGLALSNSIRPLAVAFASRFPSVEVEYRDIFSVDQTKALLNGEIDIGFLRPSEDVAELESHPIIKEGFQAILPKSHRLSARSSLRLEEIANETLLLSRTQSRASRNCIMGMYDRLGIPPRIITVAAVPTEAGGISVAAGQGIYIVPGAWIKPSSYEDNIVAIPLEDDDAFIYVHVTLRRANQSPAVRSFVSTIFDVVGVESPL